MPTGYTANIKNMNFNEFAMGCAKAFGAAISMRDEPNSAPIPERFEPSDYHTEQIDAAKADLDGYHRLTPAEIELLAIEDWERKESSRLGYLEESNVLRSKYEAMIIETENWTPPIDNYREIKHFMLDQLKKSMRFDCSGEYYEKPIEPFIPSNWINQKIEKAKHDIEYHTEQYQQEVLRVNERNLWISGLRESLKLK